VCWFSAVQATSGKRRRALTFLPREILLEKGQGSQVPVPADHIRDTGTEDFGKLLFDIVYRSKIGERLMRPVEVILYKPFIVLRSH
jgi:hypothetical protein